MYGDGGMSNTLTLDGMRELLDGLRRMPETFADEGGEYVEEATEHTASSLEQSYPLGDSGNLRRGIRKKVTRTRFGATGEVKSTSPHSHLWEFGTQNRATREGWHRGKGPEHKREGLVPIAKRNRRKMNEKHIAMLKREGLIVTGTP